jgi:hypothetical protein
MTRMPPSERLSQKAKEPLASASPSDLAGQLARPGARKLIRELREAEVSEALSREPYERTENARGYCQGRARGTAEKGPIRRLSQAAPGWIQVPRESESIPLRSLAAPDRGPIARDVAFRTLWVKATIRPST